jgi:hypothetical protein
MRSIRNFAYATVLFLSVFAAQPSPAAAEAHGTFTLSHEVHMQNYVLHPGEYEFSVKNTGSSEFILLRSLTGANADAMFLVNDVETVKPDEGSRLVLVSRNGQSFVSSMALPGYEKTLYFSVPSDRSKREELAAK